MERYDHSTQRSHGKRQRYILKVERSLAQVRRLGEPRTFPRRFRRSLQKQSLQEQQLQEQQLACPHLRRVGIAPGSARHTDGYRPVK